jgi:hypothetical protein
VGLPKILALSSLENPTLDTNYFINSIRVPGNIKSLRGSVDSKSLGCGMTVEQQIYVGALKTYVPKVKWDVKECF